MYITLQRQSAVLLITPSSEHKEEINFIVCVYPSKPENGHYHLCHVTVLQVFNSRQETLTTVLCQILYIRH